MIPTVWQFTYCLDDRSRFDRVRWRCVVGGGDSCGVWRSALTHEAAKDAMGVHSIETHGVVLGNLGRANASSR